MQSRRRVGDTLLSELLTLDTWEGVGGDEGAAHAPEPRGLPGQGHALCGEAGWLNSVFKPWIARGVQTARVRKTVIGDIALHATSSDRCCDECAQDEMLATVSMLVPAALWGKKQPEPEPEPPSVMWTVLAVAVCWVLPALLLKTGVSDTRPKMQARTIQGLLLMGTRMFQQSNRNLLGLVMVWMAKDLGFGVGERGTLLSAIAAGYFFTQIPGGALADKMGAKLVMCSAGPDNNTAAQHHTPPACVSCTHMRIASRPAGPSRSS